jgi:hypothetical protein
MGRVKILSTIALILPVLTACTGVNFKQGQAPAVNHDQGTNPPTPVTPVTPPSGCEVCTVNMQDSFQVGNGSTKADILFVVDTSPSMFVTLQDMPNRLGSFMSSLKNLDWQVGVLNASLSSYDSGLFPTGRLMPLNSDPLEYTNPASPYMTTTLNKNSSSAQWTLGQDLSFDGMGWGAADRNTDFCDAQPYCATGAPQPLKAIISAIHNRTTTFFRSGATFIPVIISAADENNGQSGATQASDVVSAFKSSLGSTMQGMTAVSFTVRPGDSACLSTYNSISVGSIIPGGYTGYATVIDQLAQQTAGTSNSLCSSDFSSALSQIPAMLGPQVSTFALKQAPLANTLKVVTTPATSISYVLVGNVLTFAEPLPAGTSVVATYQVATSK